MQKMTIGDLIRKCSAELDQEMGPAISVICYDCGVIFGCRKPAEKISETEVCGLDDCPSSQMREDF